MTYRAEELIDLDRYPIHRAGPRRDAVVNRVREDLVKDGCAVVRSFLTPKAIPLLVEEAESVAEKGHRSFNRTNAYFTADDPALPEDDPRRRFFDRSNTFIPADNFLPASPLRTIHDAPGFDRFIQDCLQEERFFRYADPLADVIVNMAEAGNGFPWHFDSNDFTVTLAIQNAEDGGAFEYSAGIREGDENFEKVWKVLDGASDRVTVLELHPGDLQLFPDPSVFAAPRRATERASQTVCDDSLLCGRA